MLAIGTALPDLFLLIVVSISLRLPWQNAALLAGFLGLGRDLFITQRLGTSAVIFFLVGAVIGRLRTEIFVKHFLTQIIVAFVFALLVATLDLMLALPFRAPSAPGLTVRAAVISSIYVGILAPVFFAAMKRVYPVREESD